MLGLFGSIQFVTSGMERLSVRAHASVNKILSSGDPVRRARHENDAGAISLAAKLSFDSAAKRNSISSFQNAISFMQLQESALNQAERIYQEMISLASLASDPSANQENRHFLVSSSSRLGSNPWTLIKVPSMTATSSMRLLHLRITPSILPPGLRTTHRRPSRVRLMSGR